jgi:hypothetical protein
MSADIEQDDVAMFAEAAWHGLGDIKHRLLTADDLEGLFARKDVTSEPVYVCTNSGDMGLPFWEAEYVEVSDKAGLTTSDGHVVAINSDRYGAIQASTLEEAACRLLTEYPDLVAGAEAAVTMGHGRKVAITLRLVDEITIPGYSAIRNLFTLADSRDGSSAGVGGQGLGVVVCANTFAAYVTGKRFQVKQLHRGIADELFDNALHGLIDQFDAQGEIAEAIDRLCNQPINDEMWTNASPRAQFHNLIVDLTGERPEEAGRGQTMWDRRHDEIMQRWNGDDIASVKSSKWGALMSIQGYEQHVAGARKVDRRVRHFDRITFGRLPLTSKAMELMGV